MMNPKTMIIPWTKFGFVGFIIVLLFSSRATASRVEDGNWSFRASPILDLHYWVLSSHLERSASTERRFTDRTPGLKKVVDRFEELDSDGTFGWPRLNPLLIEAETATAFEEACRNHQALESHREKVLTYAKSLKGIEKTFMKKVWPKRKAAIVAAIKELDKQPRDRWEMLSKYLSKGLGLKQASQDEQIVFILVTKAPYLNEGATQTPDDVKIVLGIEVDVLDIIEKASGEVARCFDEWSRRETTLLGEMRELMIRGEIPEDDRVVVEVIHAIYALHAAAAVRQIFSSDHEPWGVNSAQKRWPDGVSVAEIPWSEFIRGHLDRRGLMINIVTSAIEVHKSHESKQRVPE